MNCYRTLSVLNIKKVDCTTESDVKIYEQLVEILKAHLTIEINEIPEKYKFHQKDQSTEQSCIEYIENQSPKV